MPEPSVRIPQPFDQTLGVPGRGPIGIVCSAPPDAAPRVPQRARTPAVATRPRSGALQAPCRATVAPRVMAGDDSPP